MLYPSYLGVLVLDYSKRLMNYGIDRLEKNVSKSVWKRNDILYYTDTDSMYIPVKNHKNLGDMIGDNLG
jgi:hypothetical protein